jgi:LTXXQ motif family protein
LIAATARRTIVRPSLLIGAVSIGAVAFSLSVPATADARPRFGPAAVLGVVAAPLGAVLGVRHRFSRHHRRSEPADEPRAGSAARAERAEPVQAAAPQVVVSPPSDRPRAGFWPYAADDLLDYAFFPKGKDDRFWAYGYGAILQDAFVSTEPDGSRRNRPRVASASDKGAAAAAAVCGGSRTFSADGLIERINQAIAPSPAQRDVIVELRSALVRAIDRIESTCSTAMPATPAERLKAIQDRIWAMRDALLTLRLPFEKFYGLLTSEQHWRLQSSDPDAAAAATTGSTGNAAASQPRTRSTQDAAARTESCIEQAASAANWPMRAVERAVRPNAEQRAMLEGLRMRLMGMGQLIATSCPTYPLLGPMDRIAAATDRLNVMMFAIMTLSPALPDFYDSLSDKQKASLGRTIRQFRRSGSSGESL